MSYIIRAIKYLHPLYAYGTQPACTYIQQGPVINLQPALTQIILKHFGVKTKAGWAMVAFMLQIVRPRGQRALPPTMVRIVDNFYVNFYG